MLYLLLGRVNMERIRRGRGEVKPGGEILRIIQLI